jgi:Asp-tRNA(Asn)/Glu-tRNA(Gln) amidotransferase A subunit family amidase
VPGGANASSVRANLERNLAAIRRLDPELRAWVEVRGRTAGRQADALDALAAVGLSELPLHGLTLGVKDLFDVADVPTRAGSAWSDPRPAERDAEVVRRLRSTGAIVLGKTVTTPWAASDPVATRNPWDPSRLPGGSSTGSAVAVAAGMCDVALGTQTAGSLVRPAAYCGVAGLLPGPDVLPRDGLLPSAWTLDTVGLLSRDVTTLRRVYRAIGPAPGRDGPGPCRIGLVSTLLTRTSPGQQQVVSSLADAWRTAGVEVEGATLPDAPEEVLSAHWTILRAETATVHRERFARDPDRYEPGIRTVIEAGLEVTATEYIAAERFRRRHRHRVGRLFERYDVLLAPAAEGGAPQRDERRHRLATGDPSLQMLWTFASLPIVVVPVGLDDDGMPLAAQLIGPPGSEHRLLTLAARIEERRGPFPRPPTGPTAQVTG